MRIGAGNVDENGVMGILYWMKLKGKLLKVGTDVSYGVFFFCGGFEYRE